jgi:hypothetical protein
MESTPSVLVNLAFWLIGIVATGCYFYRLCWHVGVKYLTPAIIYVMRMKHSLLVIKWIFNSFCKLAGFSYTVTAIRHAEDDELFTGLSFTDADDKFYELIETTRNWKHVYVTRVSKRKSITVRSIKY